MRHVIPIALAVVLLPATVHAKLPKPVPCPAADYVAAPSAPPRAATNARALPLAVQLPVGITVGADGTVKLGDCPPVVAKVSAGRKRTSIRALWAQCDALINLRLSLRVPYPACDAATGRVSARKRKSAAYVARKTVCGDGAIDLVNGEECEPVAGGDAACPTQCLNCRCATCENGRLDPGETCEVGFPCIDSGAFCDDCVCANCGNGIKEGSERCDDGNTVNGDGCDTNCTVSACGNGIQDPSEECERFDFLECPLDRVCNDACQCAACGDNRVEFGEECDDGNTNNNDLCRNDCTEPRCGDGYVDLIEECDGDSVDSDQCIDRFGPDVAVCINCVCRASECGNGVREGKEECDGDNKPVNCPVCRSDCTCSTGCTDSGDCGLAECCEHNTQTCCLWGGSCPGATGAGPFGDGSAGCSNNGVGAPPPFGPSADPVCGAEAPDVCPESAKFPTYYECTYCRDNHRYIAELYNTVTREITPTQ